MATRQHGTVAHRQLLALGYSRSAIGRMLAAGRLHRLHHGVYAVGHRALRSGGRLMAATLAAGPDALLSHQSAAAHHALRPYASALVHVTAIGRSRRRLHGVVVHQTRSFHPDDRGEIDGIPITSVARTLLDVAEVLPLRQLVRVIEQAERLGLFDLRAVERLIARSFGRRGTKPLRLAIAEVNGEPPRSNSDWERDLLDFCDDHDLPRPELNVIVAGFEVDALWRRDRLVVELDSYAFHRHRAAFEADRRKYGELQLAGHRVLPVTWSRFTNEPAAVAAAIRDLLTPRAAA